MKNKIIKGVLIFFVIAAAFASSFIGARLGTANRETAADEQLLNATENIALAGYDVLHFSANQTEQDVFFYNSQKNRCFLIVSIILDGQEIYTSQMLAPNTKIENISLSNPLPVGVYENAIIRYSCFDLYTQRELNGTDIDIKLEVE